MMSTQKCKQRKMINYRETRSCVEIKIIIHRIAFLGVAFTLPYEKNT